VNHRILALITDGYGSLGGISRFNRDLIEAICDYKATQSLTVFPRIIKEEIKEALPHKLTYHTTGTQGKIDFIVNIIKNIFIDNKYDLVICGHINLLPMAWIASKITKAPLALIIHGIDAWHPTQSSITNRLIKKVDKLICVSELTINRFCEWSSFPKEKTFILPNCVELSDFTPGNKSEMLLEKYNLHNKKILLTLGRLDSFERKKGFDEVLEILPSLLKTIPNLVYLIAGDGPDRKRLEEKSAMLDIKDQVIFTGFIDENQKAALYRLADAFVMPSQGEGFGIVLLEAMASGIPVMASKLDGSSEALRQGKLGILVNPNNLEDVKNGITETLNRPKGIPDGLDYFSKQNFKARVHELIANILPLMQ